MNSLHPKINETLKSFLTNTTKLITALICLFLLFQQNQSYGQCQWNQLDSAFFGTAVKDQFGAAVSLSEDGKTFAVGAYLNNDNGSSAGHTRVYRLDSNGWQLLGSAIEGSQSDWSGYSVSLSASGDTIAVGELNYGFGFSSARGRVRVFVFNGSSWSQLGNNMIGESASDYSGRSISLAADGLTVAIGADYNDGNGGQSGHVRVYRFNGSSWSKLGNDIDGDAASDFSGRSVSISDDGNIVAIGATDHSPFFSSNVRRGQVRVFKYDSGSWNLLGQKLYGQNNHMRFGQSVSLSGDGHTLVVGAQNNTVQAFQYSIDSSIWQQLGQTVQGEYSYGYFGWSVNLSTKGDVFIAGAPYNNGGDSIAGNARIFRLINSTWQQAGKDLDGDTAGQRAGTSVALSGDGYTAAYGAPYSVSNSTNYGQAKVFSFDSIINQTPDSMFLEDCQSITLSSGLVIDTTGYFIDTLPTNTPCDSIFVIHFNLLLDTINPIILTKKITKYLDHNGLASITVNELDSGTFDNCELASIFLNKDTFSCADLGFDSIYFYARDVNNNLDSQLCIIQVLDTLKPKVKARSIKVDVGSAGYFHVADSLVEFGSSDNCGINSSHLSRDSFFCNDLGKHSVWFRVQDASGNRDSMNLFITVENSALSIDTASYFDCYSLTTTLGQELLKSASYFDTLSATNGCDSIVYRQYKILNSYIDTVTKINIGSSSDRYGSSVDISANGNVFASGGPYSYNNGSNSGIVRVHEFINNQWQQKGNGINGTNVSDYAGTSVSLSNDGNYVAFGEIGNDDTASESGQVRVFQFSSGNWSQIGNDINGKTADDLFGTSVDLASSGQIIAIGAPGKATGSASSGYVKAFFYNGQDWVQIGAKINGDNTGDHFGQSVSISGNGNIIAIGSPHNDQVANDAGLVKVYERSGSNWFQLGNSIYGYKANDQFGYDVAISRSGKNLIVGAPTNDSGGTNAGMINVYELVSGNWVQKGPSIFGDSLEEQLGFSVAISIDGNSLASGAPYYAISNNLTEAGKVKRFAFESGQWLSVGDDLFGDQKENYLGWSVATSDNADVVVTGAPKNDDPSTHSGQVKVLNRQLAIFQDNIETQDVYLCNGSYVAQSGKLLTSIGLHLDTFKNAIGCDSIRKYRVLGNRSTEYFMNVTACDMYTAPSGAQISNDSVFADTIASQIYDCDSINYITLTIRRSKHDSLSVTACDTYQAPSGKVFDQSGTVIDTLTSFNGCDSILHIYLTLLESSHTYLTTSVCDFYLSPNGKTWTSTGNYTDTLINAVGCDSVIHVDLTVSHGSSAYVLINACDSFIKSNGRVLYKSGLYKDSLTNTVGCDSLVTLDLYIHQSSSSSVAVAACREFTTSTGQLWMSSGTYFDTLTNAIGCDSIVTVNLDLTQLAITQQPADTLSAEGSKTQFTASATSNKAIAYQWQENSGSVFSNLSNGSKYAGVKTDTLILLDLDLSANTNKYRCVISSGTCIDTTENAELGVRLASIDDVWFNLIKVYPNPTTGIVKVELDQRFVGNQYSITTPDGKQMNAGLVPTTSFELALNNLTSGTYLLKIGGLVKAISIVKVD